MQDSDPQRDKKLTRRTVLKGGIIAGAAIGGAGAAIAAVADVVSGDGGGSATKSQPTPGSGTQPNTPGPGGSSGRQPNILVIVVDQLRYPLWFSPAATRLGFAPNLQHLREGAVSFARHYTASNDCTPARATLLTGLYTHQTGCMITGGSTLDPGFPTWGSMLRDHGYQTHWFGKWHLTRHDNRWTPAVGEAALEKYGFAGGVYPSPDGAPGQGWRKDPAIASAFADWFKQEGSAEPWCTTVSLVNPHDIAWWYTWTDRVPPESASPRAVFQLPPNYETPEAMVRRRKPRLQLSFQETAAASFGAVPFTGPEALEKWTQFIDLYLKLQYRVDQQIGAVLQMLQSQPKIAANTVVVFTSDHGEYGASHGMRGKGASGYEEALRVPLLVKDMRGLLTSAPERVRTQLTSSVDVAPMLLTIATGSSDWRREPFYAHLASRLDLTEALANPAARGREYVLHATDEIVTEYAIEPYAADAPLHVVAMRSEKGKFATYSNWLEQSIEPTTAGREEELYDYATHSGRLELHNSAGESDLEDALREDAEQAFRDELREPLPPRLVKAHARGFADYFSIARGAAKGAIARRRDRRQQELEELERLTREPQSVVEGPGGSESSSAQDSEGERLSPPGPGRRR
jgi:arylsulfatase A-like enzyme